MAQCLYFFECRMSKGMERVFNQEVARKIGCIKQFSARHNLKSDFVREPSAEALLAASSSELFDA